MITPNQMVTAIITRIDANKVTIGVTRAGEITDADGPDSPPEGFIPPWCGVFFNFADDAGDESAEGDQLCIPLDISVLCASSEKQTAAEAMAEAFAIALKVYQLCFDDGTNDYTVTHDDESTETFELRMKKKPFTVLMNTAHQAVIGVNFMTYYSFVE